MYRLVIQLADRDEATDLGGHPSYGPVFDLAWELYELRTVTRVTIVGSMTGDEDHVLLDLIKPYDA